MRTNVNGSKRIAGVALCLAAATVGGWSLAASDGDQLAGIDRARKEVKMLDALYKNAVVSVTGRYVNKQDDQPAAMVAKDVFAAMEKGGFHKARLVDASGNPQNRDNVAKSEFEKLAVKSIKDGKPYIDRISEKDGKKVLQAATIVPAVMKQCASCHGVKEGELLGVIVYELPIE